MQPKDNQGARRMREMFPDHGAQTLIAHNVGSTPAVVSRWYRGDRAPDPVMRAKLEDLYGIGWRLWDQDTEEPADSATGATEAAELPDEAEDAS
jgi:ribosome-binding protein aMBF1 (putative translation factor)